MNSTAQCVSNADRYEDGGITIVPNSPKNRSVCSPERVNQSFLETIVGHCGGLRTVLGQVQKVSPTNVTALITGETWTGKEIFARAIHELSPRRSKNLVKMDCAAMPAGLLESELFGHERGA